MNKPMQLFGFFFLALFVAGCGAVSQKEVVWQDPTVDLVWPAPPSVGRIRYLRTITGSADFKDDNEKAKAWRWLLGEEQNDIPLLTPLSVAADQEGVVWVADSGSQLIYKVDLARERVDYIQELAGERLALPAGLAIDNQRQYVYLSDAILNRVFVLDSEGKLLKTISPPEGFKRPAGLAVDNSGSLFVADVLDGSIAVFDNNGQFQRRIYSQSSESGRFNRPVDVAVGPLGEILVLVAASFHLEIQSSDGELIRTIGHAGDAPGSFARPKSVVIDSAGYLFVSDAAFDNIQVFDMEGNLLTFFGSVGNQPGEFSLPAGLFIDHGGRLFVADSYNHRIQVFQIYH